MSTTNDEQVSTTSPGGKHRAPSTADANQTSLRAEEAELDFERARCGIDLEASYW